MTPERLEEIRAALEDVQGFKMTQEQCDMLDEVYRAINPDFATYASKLFWERQKAEVA
jgi:hypothetical protein